MNQQFPAGQGRRPGFITPPPYVRERVLRAKDLLGVGTVKLANMIGVTRNKIDAILYRDHRIDAQSLSFIEFQLDDLIRGHQEKAAELRSEKAADLKEEVESTTIDDPEILVDVPTKNLISFGLIILSKMNHNLLRIANALDREKRKEPNRGKRFKSYRKNL